jgi:deoxyribonuclease IV
LKSDASTKNFLIGSHTSASGGYFRAAEIAGELGMRTFQLFTKNNNQWNAKPITEPEIERFSKAVSQNGLVSPIAHTSYLINLGSPNPELWRKSVDALAEEWRRAELLHLAGLVMHPGSATDKDEIAGLDRIQRGIREAFRLANPQQSKLLLENTAGQGSALGWKLEHLASIRDALDNPNYLGICLDSCHAHAAGYDLAEEGGVDRLMSDFKQLGLTPLIRAIHLNDSKKPASSRVDRHEHLGLGTITRDGIARFINHPDLRDLPMYLETEKGLNDDGVDWDAINRQVACELYKAK